MFSPLVSLFRLPHLEYAGTAGLNRFGLDVYDAWV